MYELHKKGIKQEMRTYLKTHADKQYGTYLSFQLTNGAVTDPSFEWEDDKHEFRYKGQLYDVVTVQNICDSIQIWAFKDTRENDLEKQVADIHHRNHTDTPGSHASFVKFFSAFCIMHTEFAFSLRETPSNQVGDFNEDFLKGEQEVSTPPPRC